MSAIATRVVRGIRLAGGLRALSTTVPAAKIHRDRLMLLSEAENFPDFSKFDPIYDDITENSRIIDLWKQQKAEQAGGNLAASSNVDAQVRKEHNVFDAPDDFKVNFPKRPPHQSEIFGTEGELYWSEELMIPYEQFKQLSKKTLVVKRTVQMTRKGKIPSMYALVVVGNGKGAAGYGEGKNAEVSKAVLKATRQAIKNMQQFPRYDDRTIYHDIEHKFKATKLQLWARRPGFGCRVAPMIHEVCECIGIQDIAGKIHGSRNPMNVIKATFEALQTQRLPSDLAKARGLRLLDVNHRYYGGIKMPAASKK